MGHWVWGTWYLLVGRVKGRRMEFDLIWNVLVSLKWWADSVQLPVCVRVLFNAVVWFSILYCASVINIESTAEQLWHVPASASLSSAFKIHIWYEYLHWRSIFHRVLELDNRSSNMITLKNTTSIQIQWNGNVWMWENTFNMIPTFFLFFSFFIPLKHGRMVEK